MKLLLFAVFLIAVGVVFFILDGLICKLAFEKSQRYLHFRYIVAVIAAELIVFNYYTTSGILNLIDRIIKIPFVANILNYILPNRAYEIIYMLLVIIGLNLAFLLLVNFLMGLIKGIFKDKQAYFLQDEEYFGLKILLYIPHKIVSKFYKYDEDEEKIALAPEGFSLGLWSNGIKWTFAILFFAVIAVLSVSVCWGSEQWNLNLRQLSKAVYWVPMAGFILVQQLQFFFDSEIKYGAGSYSSTGINGELEVDTEQVVKIYEKTFEKSDVLIACEKVDGIFNNEDNLYNDLSNRQIDECVQSDVLKIIINQLNECKAEHSINYQDAVATLLNGNSINVRDRIEGEILIYITAYLNYIMSQGKTVLLLCKDSVEAEKIKGAFDESMKRLNSIGSIWNICTIEDADKDRPMNLLICSFDDLVSYRILEKRRGFVKTLSCIIVTSGMFLFSQDEIRIERLFNGINSNEKNLQYILVTDVDNDSVRTAMENATKKELKLFKNDYCCKETSLMLWKEESYHKMQYRLGIGKERTPYMGVAMPLALVAAKYDFFGVVLVPSDSRPYETYYQAMIMNAQEVNKYLQKNADINSVIRKGDSDIYLKDDIKIVVIYDTDYNFYNAIWRWMKYGGKKGTIMHVVSPSYILREYFADNIRKESFLFKNNEFDALVPVGLAMKSSHISVMLVDLHDKGMTETEIMKKSREYGWSFKTPEEVLEACLSSVLKKEENYGIFDAFDFKPRKTYSKEEDVLIREAFVTLKEESIYKRIVSKNKKAVLCINNNQHYEIPVLKGNLNNYYLRDQHIVFGANLYRINSVSDGIIYASQCNDHYVYSYYPISEFSFSDYKVIDPCVDVTYIDFNIATATVKRKVPAYWRSNNGNNVLNDGLFVINDLGDNCIEEEKEANILEVNFSKSSFGKNSDKAVLALCYILNEIFKTLFPDTWQNLYAVSTGNNSIDIENVIANGSEGVFENIVRSMIPFTQKTPSAKENYESFYIVEFSCVEYGMVNLLYNNRETILMMIREYLQWYLKKDESSDSKDVGEENEDQEKIKGTYLHFGSDKIPEIFDLKELHDVLVKITGEFSCEKAESVEAVEVELPNTCSFCGRNTMVVKKLGDGRKMCTQCAEHQISEQDQVEHLCEDLIRHFEEAYKIKFKRRIKIGFKDADEIRSVVGNDFNSRVLGFYAPAGRILWLEAGGPRIAMQSTAAHELTHAWQYDYLPIKKLKRSKNLKKLVPGKTKDEIVKILLEGHAVYTEIKTMREFNNSKFAERMHESMLAAVDEYGIGYRLIYDYFEKAQGEGSHMNPFSTMERLISEIISGEVSVK